MNTLRGVPVPAASRQFHFDRRRIADEKPPHRLVFDWPEEDGAETRVTKELEKRA